MTLAEVQAALAAKGAAFGIGTIWRFFRRHRITLKKRPRTRQSRTAPTSSRSGSPGLMLIPVRMPPTRTPHRLAGIPKRTPASDFLY
jgi:hypothetical protein